MNNARMMRNLRKYAAKQQTIEEESKESSIELDFQIVDSDDEDELSFARQQQANAQQDYHTSISMMEMSMVKSEFSKVTPLERGNAAIRSTLKSKLRTKHNNEKKQEDRTMPSKVAKGKAKQRRQRLPAAF